MTRLRSLIKEVLSQPKKKDCGCGCNDCGGKAPILTEGRIKKAISEGLTYHVENKIPLHESVYRIGSEKHFALINEARKLWVRGLIDVSEDDQAILETHLGNFGMYEGEEVPLDMPMVNEEKSESVKDDIYNIGDKIYKDVYTSVNLTSTDKTVRIRDFERKDPKFKQRVKDYIKSKGLESQRDGNDFEIYLDKGRDFKGIPLLPESKKKKKKDPPLNKPKRGGSKAYYVYVRDPKTKKIKKVSFGSGGLRAKIKNKEARNAFAARHNCKNKKDRTKAGYWSCNLPRYAEQLGLGSKMNTFW